MIHFFELDDKRFLIDGNSGYIHEVEELIFDIFHSNYYHERTSANYIFNKYSLTEINEAIEEIELLKNDNMLFTDIIDIKAVIKPTLKAMCLNIAHDCNLRCKYCFASKGDYNTGKKMMSFETGKKALDFLILNSYGRKNLEVDFFGGEPLMNFQVIKDLVEYGRNLEILKEKKFRFTITTNGMLLNDDIMDFVNKEFDNIVFSLDGRKEVHDNIRVDSNGSGSYEKVMSKILDAVKKREDKLYYVRGTYTSHNLDFSRDYEFLKNFKFKEISLEPVVTEKDNELEITDEMIKQICDEYDKIYYYSKNSIINCEDTNFFHFKIDIDGGPCVYKRIAGCGAAIEYLAVTPEGDFYPCHQFVGKNDFLLGNVNEGIRNFEVQSSFSETNVLSKKECIDCWAKLFCSGGCHANAYNQNGDIKIPYKLGCIIEKKRIECAIRLSQTKPISQN